MSINPNPISADEIARRIKAMEQSPVPRRDSTEPLRVFIGYDSKEAVAFHVLSSSILRRASIPVSLIPLTLQSVQRRGFTRQRGPTEATEFSLTRFLVPYLSEYRGLSVFMDCDMLLRVDIVELFGELLAQPGKAVWCCQHDYVPKFLTKFDGHEQTKYPRKNWSSFMVFDNAQCTALTPEYVNTATGLQLHRLHWLDPSQSDDQSAYELSTEPCQCGHGADQHSDHDHQLLRFACRECDCSKFMKSTSRIGRLPLTWNWLVGEYEANPKAKNLHFTNGTPCFQAYRYCDHAMDWWDEQRAAIAPTTGIQYHLTEGVAPCALAAEGVTF